MLFTSSAFLFVFLPVVLVAFFTLGRFRQGAALTLYGLVAASLIFYGYKDPFNILILMGSVLGNYGVAHLMRKNAQKKRPLFWLGLAFNLGLLGYFKYTNFILGNFAFITGDEFTLLSITLPLAISFYTFQQIAYLADTKDGLTPDDSFSSYLLFVTFFPQLMIGPIVHHKEMMPQFAQKTFARFNWDDFKIGYLYLFSGLIKKIILSDHCAALVDTVYSGAGESLSPEIGFAIAWVATLAFAFQIYFDFSGYSDMALGIARMFGIKIPINFDSPYKARNMSEFWRGWHMTFSRWLRDYLYIPLGGNRVGKTRAAFNAVLVFLLGGLWHGAAWGFVIWGALQGLGIVLSRVLDALALPIPKVLAIALTFLFITLTWVVFRAPDLEAAGYIYQALFGFNGLDLALPALFWDHMMIVGAAGLFIFISPNTHSLIPRVNELTKRLPQAPVIVLMLIFWLSMAAFNLDSSAEFIYFDF